MRKSGFSLLSLVVGVCLLPTAAFAQDAPAAPAAAPAPDAPGDAISQADAGYMYLNAKGTSQDYNKAAYWYGLSAAQGNSFAQDGLGDRLHMRRTDRMRKFFDRVGERGIHQRNEIGLKGSIGEVVHAAPQFCAYAYVSARMSANGHETEMFLSCVHVVWSNHMCSRELNRAQAMRAAVLRLIHAAFLTKRLGVTPRT